jgi:hypothetical protein
VAVRFIGGRKPEFEEKTVYECEKFKQTNEIQEGAKAQMF